MCVVMSAERMSIARTNVCQAHLSRASECTEDGLKAGGKNSCEPKLEMF
jgi:hypothetical protein